MLKTSVIGLGNMGSGIAKNLNSSGLLIGAWNRSSERAKEIQKKYGLNIFSNIEEMIKNTNFIITSVSEDKDLIEITKKIGPLLPKGAIILDTSTVRSQTVIDVADYLKTYDAYFLDGPVSGGKEGAHKGDLVMMVGGEEKTLKKIFPQLKSFCSKIVHMGNVGSGQKTKAINQIMAAGINQAVTDSLALANAEGLDMLKVIEAVGSGAAGNWFLNHRGSRMQSGSFEPGFKVSLHTKDLKICREMVNRYGISLNTIELTLRDYENLIEKGLGQNDISILYDLKKKLFNRI